MKPLIRWTVGPVSNTGYIILQEAVKRFRRLYGHEFDYVIQHNDVDPENLDPLRNLGVNLIRQEWSPEMEYPPDGCKWKLYPPRMRFGVHEIVMDNDLLITERLPQLEQYLQAQDAAIITEAIDRKFGKYDHLIAPDVKLNVGFYGFPPDYNFSEAIKDAQKGDVVRDWETYFDDQGLITACLLKCPKLLTIPLEAIAICPWDSPYKPGSNGTHFVGANGPLEHMAWKQCYRQNRRML